MKEFTHDEICELADYLVSVQLTEKKTIKFSGDFYKIDGEDVAIHPIYDTYILSLLEGFNKSYSDGTLTMINNHLNMRELFISELIPNNPEISLFESEEIRTHMLNSKGKVEPVYLIGLCNIYKITNGSATIVFGSDHPIKCTSLVNCDNVPPIKNFDTPYEILLKMKKENIL